MNIVVERMEFTQNSTIGRLLIDGQFECFTLEDMVRDGPKVMHETAIPEGKYKVIINMSNRFKRELPLLLKVPGFEGIRIHTGNTKENTSGCILLGVTKGADFVGGSRLAFDPFFSKLQAALQGESEVWLTVKTKC